MVDNQREGTAQALLQDPFKIVSIRSVKAPSGTTGADWHRYEICQGRNQIVGFRSGDLENVTLAVEHIVVQLNDRRRHRRGRVHVVLQPKSSGSSN